MPLNIVLPIVVFGIAGAYILIYLLRPTALMVFRDEKQASELWLHQNPHTAAVKATLSASGKQALVQTDSGAGLIWAFGADSVSRLFDHPVTCVETPDGLKLKTHDFTAPQIAVDLVSPDEKAHWQSILEGKSA